MVAAVDVFRHVSRCSLSFLLWRWSAQSPMTAESSAVARYFGYQDLGVGVAKLLISSRPVTVLNLFLSRCCRYPLLTNYSRSNVSLDYSKVLLQIVD